MAGTIVSQWLNIAGSIRTTLVGEDDVGKICRGGNWTIIRREIERGAIWLSRMIRAGKTVSDTCGEDFINQVGGEEGNETKHIGMQFGGHLPCTLLPDRMSLHRLKKNAYNILQTVGATLCVWASKHVCADLTWRGGLLRR